MPAKSAKQYGLMQATLHSGITGKSGKSGPSKAVAKEFINATPAKKRSVFAKHLNKKEKKNK